MGFVFLFALLCMDPPQQGPAAEAPKPAEASQETDTRTATQRRRIEMNLLGATDTEGGEARRNENIQFNLVDNNAMKELNVRLGVTATLVTEFRTDRPWFGAEFGNVPAAPPHVSALVKRGFHGETWWRHQSSVTSARSFFQAEPVQPAHENEFGLTTGIDLTPHWRVTVDGTGQVIRGQVNGNVLVPMVSERTPLTTDPAARALITRWMGAYPTTAPNRTDVNPRALNTNSPQAVDSSFSTARLDGVYGKDRVSVLAGFNAQKVNAFELVAGQNPDTYLGGIRARVTWNRVWDARTTSDVTVGFDRLRSILGPEPNAIGPMVAISGLTTLGPDGVIPIRRAQNLFRYAGTLRRTLARHSWYVGFDLTRRQFNGLETDTHRGYFSFANDFGHDGITNFRLGLPSQYIIAVGNTWRGFRSWEPAFFLGDEQRVGSRLTLNYGLRYQPSPRPYEVNGMNTVPYGCDCNNLAPAFGAALRLPGDWGVLRTNGAVEYSEILPVTFSQIRFSPPGSVKFVVTAPSFLDPLGVEGGTPPNIKGNLYLLDAGLRVPYSYQYNFAWQPWTSHRWRLEVGYVGSRSHKLLNMWYLNRAHVVGGIPQTTATINDRRPDPTHAEKRLVVNGSRGYFDAARLSLAVPRWRGISLDAAYWFSKAMDLGSAYSNTAYDIDSRLGRSQSEFDTHADMRGLSTFDQPHSFLARATVSAPPRPGATWMARVWRGWQLSSFLLLKSGTPFTVQSGGDGPGYGNVDGNGADRPNIVDPSILGRAIGNPDTSRALLPRSAFTYMQPTDERGNLGRDTFRKGGIANVNAALARTWTVAGERRLTLRAESVNLTNTPQFAEPGFELANPNFAQITNTLNDGRTFRLQLLVGW